MLLFSFAFVLFAAHDVSPIYPRRRPTMIPFFIPFTLRILSLNFSTFINSIPLKGKYYNNITIYFFQYCILYYKKNLLTNSYFYSKLIHVISKVMHIYFGVWLSLVEHYFREVGAASSNLVTPRKKSFYFKRAFLHLDNPNFIKPP